MEKPHHAIARKAALRLTSIDPSLPQQVEAVLAGGGEATPPDQYDAATVLGLAALVVAIADFAYTVYQDMKKSSPEPKQEVVARRVRVQIGEVQGLSPEDRDRVIDIVVEETFTYGE